MFTYFAPIMHAMFEARHEDRPFTEILISYGRIYSKTKYQWKLRG